MTKIYAVALQTVGVISDYVTESHSLRLFAISNSRQKTSFTLNMQINAINAIIAINAISAVSANKCN